MFSEVIIVLILILINGVFSMAEMALISSRKTRLEMLAKHGDAKAKLALKQADNPTKFLSTVQIGITVIGILTGIFSGESIADGLELYLSSIPLLDPYSHSLSVAILVVIITYFSLVLGELVPKQIALSNAEKISSYLALPMDWVSKITSPFIWLLTKSGNTLIKVLNIKKSSDSLVTEEEIKALVEEGIQAGTIDEVEQDIVDRVFHLGDRQVASLMSQRNELVWLNVEDSNEINFNKIKEHKHSAYPVCEGNLDQVLGIVYVKDILHEMIDQQEINFKNLSKTILFFPESIKAYKALDRFKESKIHYGLVVDEFGSAQGIITINDILDAIVGNISDEFDYEITKREDGSYLIDAQLPFMDFLKHFDIYHKEENIDFHTLGGLLIYLAKRIPKTGDLFTWNNYKFEIVDMDGNRIDKVLVQALEDDK